jgi:hypothetical protein
LDKVIRVAERVPAGIELRENNLRCITLVAQAVWRVLADDTQATSAATDLNNTTR